MNLSRLGIPWLAAEPEDGIQEGALDQDEHDDGPLEGRGLDVVANPTEIGDGPERGLGVVVGRAAHHDQRESGRATEPSDSIAG